MTKSKKVKTSASQLSKNLVGAGLSKVATDILVGNLNTKTVAGAQGASIDDLVSDETTLFCVVLDETGSMHSNYDAVVASYAEMLSALKASKAADKILMSPWSFNIKSRLIHGYLPLDMVPDLSGYDPDGGTALYDATLDALTSLIAYEQELKALGNRTQAVVAIFTDGEDNSSRSSAAEVKKVADELLAKETYVLSLVAFESDPVQKFGKKAASEMGFPNLLEAGATPSEIRRAMGTVSQSTIRASQGQIGKSQSGFFTP